MHEYFGIDIDICVMSARISYFVCDYTSNSDNNSDRNGDVHVVWTMQ